MQAELVILAKSSKNRGDCVGGIDINNGQWIRLTSDNQSADGALSQEDMQYDETVCEMLDQVRAQIVNKIKIHII